ncbi:hypothetical protein ACG9YX_02595 [Acinetobacter nematophilus]|uniref:hypothetical protein n=1 Tax=Acinetobacter nematophilus TaxID=2994642 RepID=UPI003AF769AF
MYLDGKRKIGSQDIKPFMKNNFSGSCMVGKVLKMPAGSSPQESVDAFLTGLAGNASGGAYGVRLGVAVSIDDSNKSVLQKIKNYWNGDQMIGMEFGVGTPGADFNFGYGVEADKDKTVTGVIGRMVE